MRRQRMICAEVLESGAFTALPARVQMLYVHMQLFADDDGVVDNPKYPMLSCGATKKDLDALVKARFVLRAGRVWVIKHWWTLNKLQRDRHARTKWTADMEGIYIRQDRVYTDHETPDGLPFLEGMDQILRL